MALGQMPYRYKIVGYAQDANGADAFTVEYREALLPQVKATVIIYCEAGCPIGDVKAKILEQMTNVMRTDAGSLTVMWSAVIAGGGTLP